MIKRLWDWIWDIDGVRTEDVFCRSITGKPLVKCRSSLSGWSMWHTTEGLRGAQISINITQLGNNVEAIKGLLCGEFDDFLSKDHYNNLITKISQRIDDGGYYLTTKRNNTGNLDFVRVYWSQQDKEEIKRLLENSRNEE